MKKALILFLALVLMLFAFAACKDEPQETTAPTAEPTTETEPTTTTTKILENGIDEKDVGWSWSWY